MHISNKSTTRDSNINSDEGVSFSKQVFGQQIYGYSRAQAIEDGVLIDFSYPESDTADVCRQHYKHPVACTAAVFEIMQKSVENKNYCNSYAGVLHDILWMSKAAGIKQDESTVLFNVIIVGASRRRNYTLKLQVGPGDRCEPVITIMLPSED